MTILNQLNKRIIRGVFGITVLATVGLMSTFFNQTYASIGTNWITVGGRKCNYGSSGSGWCNTNELPGFSYDGNQTITLNNYNNAPISVNLASSDVTIYLKGNNTINLEDYREYGLDFPDAWFEHKTRDSRVVTITGDEGASLNIIGKGDTSGSLDDPGTNLRGIFSNGPIKILGNIDVNINLESQTSSDGGAAYGISSLGRVTIENSKVNIKIAQTSGNDTADYYGIKSSGISLLEDVMVNTDLADHNGENIPLGTSGTWLSTKSSLASFSQNYMTLTAREIEGKAFSRWNIEGVEVSDLTTPTIQYSHRGGTKTAQPIYVNAYNITVNNGAPATTTSPAGKTITITANTPENGKKFKGWVSENVTFADPTSSETTFVMPDSDVEVTAIYEDIYSPPRVTINAIGPILAPVGAATNRSDIKTSEIKAGNGMYFYVSSYSHRFVTLSIDGNTIDRNKYRVFPGGMFIRINPELLETLSIGDHTLTVRYVEGAANTTFTIEDGSTIIEASTSSGNNAIKAPDSGVQSNNNPNTNEAISIAVSACVILLTVVLIRLCKTYRRN